MKEFIENYYLKEQELGKVPEWLDIEINTNCNLVCKKCFRTYYIAKTQYMDLGMIESLLKEFGEKGGKSVRFSERGEPTIAPNLVECVQFARDCGIPRTLINTNCVALTKDLSKQLIEAGISQITCSVDSAIKETYEKLQGKNYDKVIQNIKDLEILQREHDFHIRIQANIQEENKEEIEVGYYDAFFREFTDDIQIKPMLNVWSFEEDFELDLEPCIEPWRRLIILVDGRAIVCPGSINYHTEDVFEVGNVNYESLEDVWHGIIMKNIRSEMLNERIDNIKVCRACRFRRFVNNGAK